MDTPEMSTKLKSFRYSSTIGFDWWKRWKVADREATPDAIWDLWLTKPIGATTRDLEQRAAIAKSMLTLDRLRISRDATDAWEVVENVYADIDYFLANAAEYLESRTTFIFARPDVRGLMKHEGRLFPTNASFAVMFVLLAIAASSSISL